jgi:DNA-binding YbaB/EbfC family protein
MKAQAGMGELMRQAARLQRKVERTKEELKDRETAAGTAGDKVKVTVSWGGKLRRIEVEPEFLQSEGLELALDSVVAAANNALETAAKELDAEITKATGGLKIPGLG